MRNSHVFVIAKIATCQRDEKMLISVRRKKVPGSVNMIALTDSSQLPFDAISNTNTPAAAAGSSTSPATILSTVFWAEVNCCCHKGKKKKKHNSTTTATARDIKMQG